MALAGDAGVRRTREVDAAQLVREGLALARPCVYLRQSGTEYAAAWVEGPAPELMFESRHIPAPGWPRAGLFRLTSSKQGGLTFLPGAELPATPAGVKLYAHPGTSLPPLDGVFALGSERVRAWLRDVGWPRDAGYNGNFPDRELAEHYERHYQGELPFYTGAAYAVLGGWHFAWPDSNWQDCTERQLLAWTFAGGEPWLEAWAQNGRCWLDERIT